jgi:hypothetical protein
MTAASSTTQTTVVTPPSLLDAATRAEAILIQALEFCKQEMGLESHEAVVDHLRQGDSIASSYCQYGLAKHLAEYLGTCDDDVKAVYIYDHPATTGDIRLAYEVHTRLVHMIVWAEPKTAALNSLIVALNRALAQNFGGLIGVRSLMRLLDVQVIDDVDMKSRAGYAALLSSPHYQPMQVWKRGTRDS